MQLKPDQERIKNLLSETITLMCRNGLNYKTEFCIEALIGITVDKSDVFLFSVKETIASSNTSSSCNPAIESTSDATAAGKEAQCDNLIEIAEHIKSNTNHQSIAQSRECYVNDAAIPRKKRKLECQKEEHHSISCNRITPDRTHILSVPDKASVSSPDIHQVEICPTTSNNMSKEQMDFKQECDSHCISIDSDEADIVLDRDCTADMGTGRDLLWNGDFTENVELVWNNRRGQVPMCGSESGVSVSHMDSFQFDPAAIWLSLNHTTAVAANDSYDITQPPDLKPEQVQVAVEILSISGNFVNIGSVKAVQHSLRRLTRPQLSDVLERMSVPANSPYCVGILFTAGSTRVFYKTPPALLRPQALAFYEINPDVYNNVYHAPVRVPHSVKLPADWVKLLDMRNPYYDIMAQRRLSNNGSTSDGNQSAGVGSEVKVEVDRRSSESIEVDISNRHLTEDSGGSTSHDGVVHNDENNT